jgi:poly(A) polymerase
MNEITRIKLPAIMRTPQCRRLFDALNREGRVSSLYVGGCVRDAVLGQEVTDLDVATTLIPEEVRENCQEMGFKVIPTGEDHGTLTILVDDQPFEVTTLRRDVQTDGRRAQVVYTDAWLEDAMRRDFTMNTLLADEEGRIFDPLGSGLADLKRGDVLFVGEPQERIREDYLRILRFFRFYAYYGHGVADERALAACQAEAGNLNSLSRERITQEFIKIMKSPRVGDVLEVMQIYDVLPGLVKTGFDAPWLSRLVSLQCEYDVVSHLSRLHILFHVELDRLRASETYLVYSNQAKKFLEQLYKLWMEVADCGDYPVKQMLYRYGRDVALQGYVLYCSYHDRVLSSHVWTDLNDGEVPVFPMSGEDLIEAGMQQSAELGRILKEVEAWWVEQGFQPGHDACLCKAKDLIG